MAFSLRDITAIARGSLVGRADEPQSGVGLTTTEKSAGVEMESIVAFVVESEVPLGVERGGFGEVGVEAGPDKRTKSCWEVGSDGGRGVG